MAFYRVPGVSIAVIEGGRMAWAKGYGVLSAGGSARVNPDTLFQAASISKAVTATAAMKLVQEGRLSLDAPVNASLHAWNIPATRPDWAPGVTLRRLLSHTAGTGAPGYLGYPAGQRVPSVLEVLRGEAPATSPPVQVERAPGQAYRYSGGGYEVIELLMEETGRQPFPELMQRELLRPLGMTHSTFAQPLPGGLAKHAAQAHTSMGQPLAGRWHIYPERAAAGLWSTPSDLARWLLVLSRSANAREGAFLNTETMRQMLTDPTPGLAHWFSGNAYGLGLKLQGSGRAFSFSHTGINQGYRAVAILYPRSGQGVVVMTNGENGETLAQEIVRGVAATYDWPEQQTHRAVWLWAALFATVLLVVVFSRRQLKKRSGSLRVAVSKKNVQHRAVCSGDPP